MRDCTSCGGCGGSCGSGCGGCAKSLSLTPEEISFLQQLGQLPFLPLGRTMGDLTPIYLEEGEENREFYSLLLQCLEKKGLVSLDYDQPLKGYEGAWYAACPIRGSMALTQRGQQVLALLEYQGAEE